MTHVDIFLLANIFSNLRFRSRIIPFDFGLLDAIPHTTYQYLFPKLYIYAIPPDQFCFWRAHRWETSIQDLAHDFEVPRLHEGCTPFREAK